MLAASIAFIVWALAVPNNTIVTGPGWSAIVGVAALLVSSVLNLLEDAVSPSSLIVVFVRNPNQLLRPILRQ
jgi:hypothetical protein